MPRSWSWEETVARRVHRSHLIGRVNPATVARDVCGLQAQVPSAAELGVAIRSDGLDREGYRSLLAERRELVRTYAMRGTACLLAGEDLPLYLAAMRGLRGGDWVAQFGLDADQARRVFAAIAESLDGVVLTRGELVERIREVAGPWVFEAFDESLAELSVAAAYAGVLAYGPPQGSKATFVRPDQWCPTWSEVDERFAPGELVRRYLDAYGPVVPADLARWLALPAPRVRELVAGLGEEVVEVEAAGRRAWLIAGTEPSEPVRGVWLLPQYDCYLLGSGPSELLTPDEVRPLLRRRNTGRWEGASGLPVVLVDGVVAGAWQRTAKRRKLLLDVEMLRPLGKGHRVALEEAAARVAEYYGAEPELTVSTG